MIDDDEMKSNCIGTGYASTTDRRRPTAGEQKEISAKRPIGFVHFEKNAARPVARRVNRTKKKAG
jgi:hypothetical protein